MSLLAAGCGEDPASTPRRSEAPRSAAPADVERYLLEADDIPGLAPVSTPFTDPADPFELDEEGARRLERSGYVSSTYQPAEGDGIAGVSSVLLFDTEAGAQDWMAYETSIEALELQIPDGRFRRFEVPAIPGATGWTGPDLHGNAIGNVYWTQGRCMLIISIEVEGPRRGPLSAGAEAIYERTGGTCPE